MKLNTRKFFFVCVLLLVSQLVLSNLVFASGNDNGNGNGNGNGNANSSPSTQLNSSPANYEAIVGSGIRNPLKSHGTVEFLFTLIRNFLIIIVVLTVVMVIYGGFRLLSSQGSEAGVKAGKQTIIWALIGLAVSLFAFSIIGIVRNYFDTLK